MDNPTGDGQAVQHDAHVTAVSDVAPEPEATGSAPELKMPHFGMAVICFILFLTFLDNTVISATLSDVQSGLHAGVAQLQWVVSGYALAFASLMLMAGTLGDLYGRKRLMLIGVVIFCGGSVLSALAGSTGTLIAGRVVMGIGAACSEPGTLSMIRHLYPERRRRARALGIWAAVSGLALAMGPVIGGVLVGIWDWRAVFWFNLIFGAVALIAAAIVLPENSDPVRARLDVPGFVLGAVALGCATFATIAGEPAGYINPKILTLYGVAVLALVVFVLVELRAENPDTIVVSAGDLTGASPLLSNLFVDEPSVLVMNALGLDYEAVGNHDFDRGLAELTRLAHGVPMGGELDYIDDEGMRKNVHRSLNRGESYHQLRSAIAKVSSRKLVGKTEIELTINNECARLLANCMIFYNASLLSGLYEHYKLNKMEDEWLKVIRLSPVAWQHINLIGIYEFYNKKECLNLHDVIEKLVTNKKIDLLAAS